MMVRRQSVGAFPLAPHPEARPAMTDEAFALAMVATHVAVAVIAWIVAVAVTRDRINRALQDAPMTQKQEAFIASLCRERNQPIPDMTGWTNSGASLYIDSLKAIPKPSRWRGPRLS